MHAPLELAESFIRAGELNHALEALDQHLVAAPDDADARRLRIDVLLRLPGRASDALSALNNLKPLTADDHLQRANILEILGDEVGAFAAVEQAWMEHSDLRSAELMLRFLQRWGESARGLELLADLPKTWKWLGWSGDFYALRGDYSIAEEHYCSSLEQLERIEPSAITETQRAHLLLKRADAYRRLKRFADADADYRTVEAIIPDDPLIPFNRGLLIYEQGNLRGALPLCRDAMDHAPDALRDLMRNTLMDEPRYRTLAQALLV
jgi:tetratricopeptide (TPR) repeat protein